MLQIERKGVGIMKEEILKFVNKEKMAAGFMSGLSKKAGIPPMYLRGGAVALTLWHPVLATITYGGTYAVKKYREKNK